MAGKNTPQYHQSRPPLSSQQSSSVPSTPHQRARRDFTGSRSPSPHGRLSGSHSPGSIHSEVNGYLSSLPKGRPVCKYEGNARLSSRRRMQYDIGDATLEDPQVEPKNSLDPNEDKKLTGDMRELYDRLLPSEDSEKRRHAFVRKLERILHKEWPGHKFTVHVFGSSGNMLCTSDSDVDICIQTPMKELETMHQLAAALDNNGMEKVVCVQAKVRIVKVWDPEYKLAADLNVNNTLALENTRMIKLYVQLDERVRPLVMIIKHWTKQRLLNDAGIGGTLSSYAWICMIINFLQTRQPPILPSLHQRPHKSYVASDGTESGFDDSIDPLLNLGKKNESSLGQLLFQFFRYYGFEFKYDKFIISVRHGRLLKREEKGWQTGGKDGQWRLCIEEPFNSTRNLGNSADPTAFRGIHLELRSAFNHICNFELDKMMEMYEFPPEEKHIFKRPQVSKPTLAAPSQNSGRKHFGAGGSMRSNRPNGRGNHSGASSRRSSTSQLGRNNFAPYISSPMLPPEILSAESLNSYQWQQWQMLAQAQAVHSVAAAHAHTVVQSGNPIQQPRDMSNSTHSQPPRAYSVSATATPLVNGSPFYPNFLNYFPMDQSQPMVQSVSQDGSRTNPSSPSLGSSVPARRGLQRSSVSNGSSGASIRSQSQPPRQQSQPQQPQPQPQQNVMMPFGAFGYDNSGQPRYAISSSEIPSQFGYQPMPGQAIVDSRPVGYYVDNRGQQIPMAAPSADLNMGRIKSQSELAQRREKSQRDLQPLALGSDTKISRSPSPGHSRHMSTPLRSAPLPSVSKFGQIFGSVEPNQSSPFVTPTTQSSMNNGLLIVNGSSYTASPTTGDSSRSYAASTPEENSNMLFPTESPAHETNPLSGANYHPGFIPELIGHHDMDTLTSNLATGLSLQNMHMDSSGAVSPYASTTQPFPALVDHYGAVPSLTTPEEEQVMSPTSSNQYPWQSLSPYGTTSSAGSAKDAKDASKSPSSKSAPLLSPVMETRTPSPNTPRKSENWRPLIVNGNLANGMSLNETLSARAPEPVPPTPLSTVTSVNDVTSTAAASASSSRSPTSQQRNPQPATSTTTGSNSTKDWQTTEGRKRAGRKRARSGPVRSNESSTLNKSGQPVPSKPEDRKGG